MPMTSLAISLKTISAAALIPGHRLPRDATLETRLTAPARDHDEYTNIRTVPLERRLSRAAPRAHRRVPGLDARRLRRAPLFHRAHAPNARLQHEPHHGRITECAHTRVLSAGRTAVRALG